MYNVSKGSSRLSSARYFEIHQIILHQKCNNLKLCILVTTLDLVFGPLLFDPISFLFVYIAQSSQLPKFLATLLDANVSNNAVFSPRSLESWRR